MTHVKDNTVPSNVLSTLPEKKGGFLPESSEHKFVVRVELIPSEKKL